MIKSQVGIFLFGILLAVFSVRAQESAPVSGSTTGQEKLIEENEKSFTINFNDVELEQIIKTFSELTGKNFILEKIPKGKITIISPARIPKDQALNIFQAILNLNGYQMVQTSIDNLYRIVPLSEAVRSNIPIYLPKQKLPRPDENFITRFIPLDYLEVQQASNLVQPLLSKEGASVIPYQPTNTLIVVDTALNIERILKVLKALDVPSLEPEMEIVPLKYASASELAGTLTQIFQETATAPKSPAQVRYTRSKTKPSPSVSALGTAPGIKIIPETRLNSLILIADRPTLKEAKRIISLLDVETGEKGIIHVYYCKNAVAKELANTLASLSGAGFARAFTAQPRERKTQPSRATTGTVLSGGLFEGEIKITADEATNSLIIIASPRDYETLLRVIEKLDIPRRQVFVEAVLLEVTLDQTRQAGTSFHAGSPLEDEGMVMGSVSLGGLNSLTLLSLLSQGVELPGGLTIATLGKPLEVPGTEGMQVPSAGMILQMIASDSNINVLSTPTILTTDNEEAEIQVGQRIPVPTGQTVSTGGLSSVSISRETVGIKLQITPQINESGTIRLEIYTEISSAAPSPMGINPNVFGVATTLKTATTTVIVKNGQTIVIGGLMEDRRSLSNSRIPFIGDLPVLGWLFKNYQRTKNKTNLIILLTPHIVRSDEDVARVREKFHRDYDAFIEESLGGEFKRWDKYFESQYQESFQQSKGAVIDLTGNQPKVLKSETSESNSKEEIEKTPETKKEKKKKWRWKKKTKESPENG